MAKGDQFDKHYQRQREEKERARKDLPKDDEPPLPPPVEPIKNTAVPPRRNDPCPCGSRKKYKQCCGRGKE